jgi:hypothetical protein
MRRTLRLAPVSNLWYLNSKSWPLDAAGVVRLKCDDQNLRDTGGWGRDFRRRSARRGEREKDGSAFAGVVGTGKLFSLLTDSDAWV